MPPFSASTFKCTFQCICIILERAIKILSDLEIRLQALNLKTKPYYVIERVVVSDELHHSAIQTHTGSAMSTIDITICH